MITKGERKLWEFENNMSGGFYSLLFQAIAKADIINKNQLMKSYPEEVEAMARFQNEKGYWEKLDNEIRKGENNG